MEESIKHLFFMSLQQENFIIFYFTDTEKPESILTKHQIVLKSLAMMFRST